MLPDGSFYYGGKVQQGLRDVEQLIGVFKKRVTTNQVRAVVHACPYIQHVLSGGDGCCGATPHPAPHPGAPQWVGRPAPPAIELLLSVLACCVFHHSCVVW